ncbi:hypothetical protein GGR65_001520 [Xanthomonas sp. 3376]|nr:hypothetical protein [Xanthomonas arboricola]
MRVGTASTGQHAFHRLLEIAASAMAGLGRVHRWCWTVHGIALRLGETLFDKLGVVVQMRGNLAPRQSKAAIILAGTIVVIFVDVVLALTAAARKIAVIDEMLHQSLRLRLHVEAVGRVDAVMRAGAVDELTQTRGRRCARSSIRIEA